MVPTPHFGFIGFGAHVPDKVLTNRGLEQLVQTSDEWIRRRTGIRTRRILGEEETILDMAVSAARRALRDAGIGAEQLDDIRVGVNTWMRFPSLAAELQGELGASGASAADVSAGCAGFIYAVEEAYDRAFLRKARYGRTSISLVVGVDGLSHITDWTDRDTCVLLGDGAGAVVLGEVDEGGILAIHTSAQGQYSHLLYSDPVLACQRSSDGESFLHDEACPRPYLRMDGPRVYPIAVKTMVREVQQVIAMYNDISDAPIHVSDIDYIYPHQANLRIIEHVAETLEVPLDRVYSDGVRRYGNTSTASIPLGYCDVRDRNPRPRGDRFEIDVAFGAGFASGAILRRVPA